MALCGAHACSQHLQGRETAASSVLDGHAKRRARLLGTVRAPARAEMPLGAERLRSGSTVPPLTRFWFGRAPAPPPAAVPLLPHLASLYSITIHRLA